MACSDSGPTPSCSVAASASASTSRASDAVRRSRTVIVGAAPSGPWPSDLGMSRARLDAGAAVAAGFEMVAIIALNRDEAVPDVADGADQGLVLGAELCPKPAYVHVDGPGAAEVVVSPDLLQQLGPGKNPSGVLGQELQQFEFLER